MVGAGDWVGRAVARPISLPPDPGGISANNFEADPVPNYSRGMGPEKFICEFRRVFYNTALKATTAAQTETLRE